MAFPGESEVDLILALQIAAVEDDGWGTFLGRLAGMTGARFAAMIARSPGIDVPATFAASMPTGTAPAIALDDVGRILTDRMRPERVYTADELAELALRDGSALDGAFVRIGAPGVRAIRLAVPDTGSVAVGIFAATDFEAADGAVLRRLSPYLQVATRTAARLRRERLRAAITDDQARSRGLGWLLLDRGGFVVEASLAGYDPSSAFQVVPGPDGDRLAFADRGAGSTFARLLDLVAATPDTAPHAVRVSHDPALYLRVAPWSAVAIVGPKQPVAIATIHGEDRVVRAAADLLVDLFALLPSEARLAAALAEGDGLAEAARRLGLTVETARNYSKKIFAKTGTTGQTDLVRLIFANGLAAPDRPRSLADDGSIGVSMTARSTHAR